MTAPLRPDGKFLLAHPAHWIALGLGSGLPRIAPGTWGTLAGWALYVALDPWLAGGGWPWAVLGVFAVGAWAAQVTGRHLGAADSSHIVIDEIVAFWIVLLMLPADTAYPVVQQAAAFLIFRFFDIVKPPPIRAVDARFKNGLGVMADDLIAAFYTLLLFALWVRLA
ncbi:MAG: phosphatidylglycerophosphatase A [Betaproteobacteria bacterium]